MLLLGESEISVHSRLGGAGDEGFGGRKYLESRVAFN